MCEKPRRGGVFVDTRRCLLGRPLALLGGGDQVDLPGREACRRTIRCKDGGQPLFALMVAHPRFLLDDRAAVRPFGDVGITRDGTDQLPITGVAGKRELPGLRPHRRTLRRVALHDPHGVDRIGRERGLGEDRGEHDYDE